MKKFILEKIHIMVQLVFAGVNVIIQFSISLQGSAADLSLYQFSWRVKERRRPSDVTNLFIFFNAHLLAHLDISYLRWSIFEENEEHIFDRVRTAFHRHFQQTTPW